VTRPALLLITLPLLATAAPVPKALKKAPPNFDGTWELVRQNNNDREVPQISPWRWEIDGDKLHRHWGGGNGRFSREERNCWFVRPEGATADEMDYVPGTDRAGAASPGRAAIEDGEFVVCWSDARQPRPAELKPGPGVNYYRFKRVSDK
jgi:uncharacterized protein (TIGR03067 family)